MNLSWYFNRILILSHVVRSLRAQGTSNSYFISSWMTPNRSYSTLIWASTDTASQYCQNRNMGFPVRVISCAFLYFEPPLLQMLSKTRVRLNIHSVCFWRNMYSFHITGEHQFSWAVMPHKGHFLESDVPMAAYLFNSPLHGLSLAKSIHSRLSNGSFF